ncbi:uncharacterized protein DSM5745_03800 [Aspergillus mulundensis]|uniref:LysM domain-containing protein n=1 Tax=Aspergillus mulundensis TaxID=1810919 RepID=A0A3D8SMY8_9EURO|nr:hypothetical protein DSM5745_03800 [Aspergillus mulundensis]RDW87158.1 hypothetical protein DSM5745_03800 [Aspergillus mulundensis]
MFFPNKLLHYLVLAFLLTSVFAASATKEHHASALKDVPPGETAPSGPTRPGTPANCVKWYTAQLGDTCGQVTLLFGISLEDFYKWNPSLKADCETNFWAKYAYCVGVGDVPVPTTSTSTASTSTTSSSSSTSSKSSTSSGSNGSSSSTSLSSSSTSSSAHSTSSLPYSTSSFGYTSTDSSDTDSSTATSSTTKPASSVPVITTSGPPFGSYTIINPITTPSPSPYPTRTNDTWPPTHTMPGQPDYCNKWHKVVAGDTCDTIQSRYAVWCSYDQLLEWNPGLAVDCDYPFIDWWVCVGIVPRTTLSFDYPTGYNNGSIPEPTVHTPTEFPTNLPTWTASPTQDGLATGCQAYYQAEKGDTCSSILKQYYYLTEKELHDWNPALKDDCSGILAGYYYCVAAFPNGQHHAPPTVTGAPSPTDTDTVKECTAWYKATADDSCNLIALKFGTFSAEQFIKWNPSVFQTCNGLQKDHYYCVAVPDTPTTPIGPLPTASPTSLLPRQPNVIKTCTFFWPVSIEDTCEDIVAANAITMDEFLHWNPDLVDKDVGKDVCANLLPGYDVCIEAPGAGSGSTYIDSSSAIPSPSRSLSMAIKTRTSTPVITKVAGSVKTIAPAEKSKA